MINWTNTDSAVMGSMRPPVMRVINGRKHSDHSGPNTSGFWCRKSIPVPDVQRAPRNRVPYDIQDPHFSMAAVSLPGTQRSGTVFQASNAGAAHASEITFTNSRPQARCVDANGRVSR